jgi:hypothetical protein
MEETNPTHVRYTLDLLARQELTGRSGSGTEPSLVKQTGQSEEEIPTIH